MKRRLLLTIIAFYTISAVYSQQIITESDTHIYWQADRKLTNADFQKEYDPDGKYANLCDQYNMCTIASLGSFSILDTPSKKKDRGKLMEKVYFAPAFEKSTSYMLDKNDSVGIKKQQLVFDIYEISARLARKEILDSFHAEGSKYGAINLAYKRTEARVIKYRDMLVKEYTNDVYIEQKEGAYEQWRTKIDEQLEETKAYATTPEDCYRFVVRKAIVPKYEQAEYIIGLPEVE